jgi:4-hydroxythreonine-4-phosphate dehydrogenase
MKPVIAITMGDPGGVGPEIILKSLRNSIPKKTNILLIGSEAVFRIASKRFRLPFHPNVIKEKDVRGALASGRVNFLDTTSEAEYLYRRRFKKAPPGNGKVEIGKVSKWNGSLSYASISAAARLANSRAVHGMVTAPIHKSAIRLIAPKFSGHTGFLARAEGVKEHAMMFVSKKLCVTLVTIHLSLKKVARALRTPEITSKICLTSEFLKRNCGIKKPKIGVASLNPHGREFGTEDEAIIRPAVRAARKRGVRAEGPLPGDQVFHSALVGEFDAVVAMYHDQGLAPFKMIAFQEGVNVTLGLPYLRTSPDHGTAFDIAYQNKAFPTAFKNSIKLVEQALS